MKDANAIYRKCKKMVEDLGIETGYVWKVLVIDKRNKWGQCRGEGCGVYTIFISSILLDDSVPDEATESTMLHEILHTVDGCLNHGPKWKRLATKVNQAYGYNIKRLTSEEEKGEEVKRLCAKRPHKHMVKCQKCGKEVYRDRESKLTKNACLYTHRGCGGTFKRMY